MVAAGRSRASISRRTRRAAYLSLYHESCELDVVKRTITISIEQLSRPQPAHRDVRPWPGDGLHDLADPSLDVVGLGPKGATVDERTAARGVNAPFGVRLLSRLWPIWPLGVPKESNVVHATSMAGPFAEEPPTRCTRSRCTTCCGVTSRESRRRRRTLPRSPTEVDR